MEESGCTNLEGEAAGLLGFGEVFAGALLVVCVELEGEDSSAFAASVGLKQRRRDKGTSRSSSLSGFALSLRESSTAFLKAAVWATMVGFVESFLGL